MKPKTLLKNIFRDIYRSFSRFISIILIVIIGAGFYTGVKASAPDMVRNINKYFEEYNLMDLHYQSSFGFTIDNLKQLETVESIKDVEAKYHVDVISEAGTKNETIYRIHSYSPEDLINKYELVDGRFPESTNEIVLESNNELYDLYEIGSLINFTGNGLSEERFTIVGFVTSPMYLNYERGMTNVGRGIVDYYAIALVDTFDLPVYTDFYITLNDTVGLDGYKKEYIKVIDEAKGDILNIINGFNIDATIYQYARTNLNGYYGYYQDSEKVNSIANVFPIFFILIAMLVTLSTMTRMVAEQRIEIGTLSSLGSSKGYILSKYMIYAFIATFFGTVVGVTLGMMIIPQVVHGAFDMNYILPKLSPYFRWDYFGINIGVAVLSTQITTILACLSILKDNPANLLRAKAPVAGKKTVIERIKFIWNRFGFNSKMTIRNLFRYKKRTLITIIGIAGCTGLMLTGFGLYNAIHKMGEVQFTEIFTYDGIAIINPYIPQNQIEQLNNDLAEFSGINDHILVFQDEVNFRIDNEDVKATIVVPEDRERIDEYIKLKTRRGQNKLTLNDNGVIINEKLAKLLNIKLGEKITFRNSLGNVASLTVSGITENYTNHFIYITSNTYQEYLNDFTFNAIYMHFESDEIYEEFITIPNVLTIIFANDNQELFKESSGNLTSIVVLIIVASAMLAFVVLYNLSNINITERTKELSTFKVIGMTDSEVTFYIARENIFSTAIGILVGLLLGIFFLDYVIGVIEYKEIMFIQKINPGSYILTTALTIVFAIFVSLVSHKRTKDLDMVEAMKAIE